MSWSENNVVNSLELRVIGMSRSGNHAIINWILSQISSRYCFLNCAEPRTNPYWTARPMDDGRLYLTNIGSFSFEREQAGRFSRKDYFLFSHEDVFLSSVARDEYNREHDLFVGSSGRRIDVLILRDPYNLFASRLKLGLGVITPGTAVRIWKQHAREFAGVARYLKQPRVLICFNDWVRCREYRQAVAAQLELQFTDQGFGQVPRCGGGSSFQGRTYHGRAHKMPLFDRWRPFLELPEYVDLFDEEVVNLSRRIFGPQEIEEQLLPQIRTSRPAA